MEITHNWVIRKLVQKNDGTGTVIRVYFKIYSTDGEYSYVSGDNIELDVNNIQNFISYQDLTQEQVLEWVKNELGPGLGGYEQLNTDWIINQRNPFTPTTKIERLPWEPEPILE